MGGLADDPAVDVAGPDDVDLAAAIPRWVAGAGLQLEYRFTAESSHAASDDTWSSYTRSVVVPARALPEALVPFAALPPVAAGLGPLDPDVRIGGWALVSAPPVEAGAMLEAFLGEPGSGG